MGLLDDAIREHLELKRRRGADAGDISREETEALGPVRRGPDGAPDLADTFAPGETAAAEPAAQPAWQRDQPGAAATPPPAYEPPPPPPAPVHEPPAAPPYEPPPPAYEPPTAVHEPLSPPPASERPWFEAQRSADEFELDPVAGEPESEPDGDVAAEPEPEHPSLLSRFRVGRRKHEPQPAPADDPPPSFEPPPLPSSYETGSAYEPPPATPPPSYGYQPPAVQHEPDIVPADDEPDVEDVLEETPDFLEETPEHDRLWFEQRPPRDFDFDDK